MKSLFFLFFTVYFTNCGLVHPPVELVADPNNLENNKGMEDEDDDIFKNSNHSHHSHLILNSEGRDLYLELWLSGRNRRERVNRKYSSFDYNLKCPSIECKSHYILMGQLDDIYIDGKLNEIYVEGDGNLTVTTGLYRLLFHGNYEIIIGDDLVEHAHIISHTLDFDVQEMVVFNFTNLYGGDKEKSDTLHRNIRENWRSIEKKLRVPVLNGFMDVFIENLNDFLNVIPIEEAIPKWCQKY